MPMLIDRIILRAPGDKMKIRRRFGEAAEQIRRLVNEAFSMLRQSLPSRRGFTTEISFDAG